MTKPTVFCYKDYTDLKAKYTDLLYKFAHLKDKLTNYEIRCRIAETDLEYYKANQESIESLKGVIDTQHDTIETYHKIVAYQQTEIDSLKSQLAEEALCGTERVKREDVIKEATE